MNVLLRRSSLLGFLAPTAAAFSLGSIGIASQQSTASSFLIKSSPFHFASASASALPREPFNTHRSKKEPVRMISSILDMLGGKGNELISPDKALPGRSQKMPISGTKHYVLGNDIEEVPEGFKVAVFANGCFWGSEKGIWRLPFGIHSTAVGYCAGFTPNPTYEEACSGLTGHTEGVRVVYDPNKISFVDIMRWFWEAHDPCSGMGQGNDRGTQYRSGFYYFDDEQKRLIESSKKAYEKQLGRPITTEVAAASDYEQYGGLWYFAEKYHQQYLAKPGSRPYCSAQPQGVSLADFESWCPDDLKEKHAPKLNESFWKKYGPQRGCSVVKESDDPIRSDSF